jgi:hypothetical protein
MAFSLRYAVTAFSLLGFGCRSDPTSVVTPLPSLPPLPAPASLGSISLNGAIHLQWTDNAYQSDPERFESYRVYSTSYDLDRGECVGNWVVEGITVSNEFLAAALSNGVPQCFRVSAISDDGGESGFSPAWQDTPRPDARNVLVYAFEANSAQSGFRFWRDANTNGRAESGEFGLVQDGALTDIDFWIFRDAADSSLWLVPEFSGTSMQLYSTSAVGDLTSIDYAPAGGYSRNMFQAAPGYGYVFMRVDPGSIHPHYAGLRVTHVGRQYLIFDFSVQTDPGNPELLVMNGGLTASLTGSQVSGSQ